MLAAIVGIGIAAAILFVLVGAALVTWGVLGALIVFGGIALGIAWISDRRRAAQYDEA
jgi:xanthine/uracil/vitamin C permease (AzgA family)